MATWPRIVIIGPSIMCLASCGGSATAPMPTQASITVALSPNPVISTDCEPAPCQAADGRLFRWRLQGTLTIQETAGIGGLVDSITVTAFNPQFVYTSADIVQRSGTNRVAAHGVLVFPLTSVYGLVDNPNATRQVVLPFVVRFIDDRGNAVTGIAQWNAS